MSDPAGPTITQGGTPGSTTYSYVVVAYGANGYVNHTAASSAGSTNTGPGTLNGTNYNIVTTAAVTNSSICAVYRTVGGTRTGKIGYVACGSALNDVGLTGDSSTAPSTNTSMVSQAYGTTVTAKGNTYGYGTQETIGQKLRRMSARAFHSNPMELPWLTCPPAWQVATAYAGIGSFVTNGGNVYLLSAVGTSAASGGPTGTAAAPITDNAATWYYYGATPTSCGATPSVSPAVTLTATSPPPGLTNVFHSAGLISGNFTWNTGMPALMGNSGAYCGYLSFLAGNGMGCGFNSVSFMTDAPKIGIGIYGGGGTSATVLVDDQYVMGPGDIITTVGYPEYVVLDYASSGTGTRARKVTVEFQGGNSNSWGAAVAPQYSVWPVAFTGDRIRAVFEGDSLTGGGGGFPVLPNGDWPGIASKLLGISDPWNVAQGSTGYCTAGSYQTFGQRIQNVTSANPDIVIVSGGTNDEGAGYTPTQIQACVTTYLQNLRAALPATPIIVQGVWPQATGPSAQRIATENAISAAVTAVADSLIYFVPVSTATPVWSSGTGNVTVQTGTGQSDIYTAPDGSHITEAGIDYLGRRAANAYRNVFQVIP